MSHERLIAKLRREAAPDAWPLGAHYKALLAEAADALEAAAGSRQIECAGIPIREDGSEIELRTLEECRRLIWDDHHSAWVNDPKSGILKTVDYRVVWRYRPDAWQPIEDLP